jgi:hypothetical protein
MGHKLDDATIDVAKKEIKYMCGGDEGFHEHNDCVRIAYEWLSAQKKTKSIKGNCHRKHEIESWGGRYVSMHDVELAAHILGITVKNWRMGISKNSVLPCMSRLNYIGEANSHGYSMRSNGYLECYTHYEYLPGSTKPISQIPDDIRSYFQTDGTKRKIT